MAGVAFTGSNETATIINRTLAARSGPIAVLILLVTYAVFLILEDATKMVFGVDPYYVFEPRNLLGNVEVGSLFYVGYDLALIGLAIVYRMRTMRSMMIVQVLGFSLMFLSIGQVPIRFLDGWLHTAARVNPLTNVLREDEPRESLSHEAALRNAPKTANGLFIVPKIVE